MPNNYYMNIMESERFNYRRNLSLHGTIKISHISKSIRRYLYVPRTNEVFAAGELIHVDHSLPDYEKQVETVWYGNKKDAPWRLPLHVPWIVSVIGTALGVKGYDSNLGMMCPTKGDKLLHRSQSYLPKWLQKWNGWEASYVRGRKSRIQPNLEVFFFFVMRKENEWSWHERLIPRSMWSRLVGKRWKQCKEM